MTPQQPRELRVDLGDAFSGPGAAVTRVFERPIRARAQISRSAVMLRIRSFTDPYTDDNPPSHDR